MNIEQKKQRLELLESIPSLQRSDQEQEEIEQLKDDIVLMKEDFEPTEEEKVEQDSSQTVQEESGRAKRSIAEFLIDKIRERQGKPVKQRVNKPSVISKIITKLKGKDATWDEIQQLKLNAIRARLKKDIAMSNAKVKELKYQRIDSILGMMGGQEPRKANRRTTRNKAKEPKDDLMDMFGFNDKRKIKF